MHEHLPDAGVPYGIERGGLEMGPLEHFAPNLSGPATRHTPLSADQDESNGSEEDGDEEEAGVGSAEALCSRAPDALISEDNANAAFLISLDGSPDDDAIGKLAC